MSNSEDLVLITLTKEEFKQLDSALLSYIVYEENLLKLYKYHKAQSKKYKLRKVKELYYKIKAVKN